MAVSVFYANRDAEDIGVLKEFKLDMSISTETGNNNYEVQTSIGGIELDEGYYVYVENTEYGGIVDTKRINTKTNTLYYTGRTWRGILESKVIVPPSGQDYYTVSGDLNTVLGNIVSNFGLNQLFYASSEVSGESVTNYKFYRYTDVYSGIVRLLSDIDYKLVIEFDTSQFKCKLSAVPVVDYGQYQEVTSDLYNFDITKVGGTVNHLIGLGTGELRNRQVVHKYADASGNISNTQTLFGKDEVVGVYDNSNAKDLTELEQSTIEQFKKLIGSDSVKITFNEINIDVGDKITAYEEHTGIEAVQYVQSKVISIDDDTMNSQYSAKNVKSSNSGYHPDSPSLSPDDFVKKTGDTMTGDLYVAHSNGPAVWVKNTASGKMIGLHSSGGGNKGLFDVDDNTWLIYGDVNGESRIGRTFHPNNTYIHKTFGIDGTAGHVRIARLTITGVYVNVPIEFKIIQRGYSRAETVWVRFKNANNTDPELEFFYASGSSNYIYIKKASAGVWDLYVTKTDMWDEITVTDFRMAPYMESRMTVTWQTDQVSSLSGATQASWAPSDHPYVVSYHSDVKGYWNWRIWSDGFKECWVHIAERRAISSAWGILYESPYLQYTYPTQVQFTYIPMCIGQVGGSEMGAAMVEGYGSGSTTQTPRWHLVRPNSTGEQTYPFNIYACGY